MTTHLELEFGCWPVGEFYSALEGRHPINYGCSVGHIPTRVVRPTPVVARRPCCPSAGLALTACGWCAARRRWSRWSWASRRRTHAACWRPRSPRRPRTSAPRPTGSWPRSSPCWVRHTTTFSMLLCLSVCPVRPLLPSTALARSTVSLSPYLCICPGSASALAPPEPFAPPFHHYHDHGRGLWAERGIDEGGIGIGAGIAYTPGSDHREVLRLQQCCAKNKVTTASHHRTPGVLCRPSPVVL